MEPSKARGESKRGSILLFVFSALLIFLILAVSWVPDSRMTELHWLPRWVAALADRDPNIRTAVPFIPVAFLLLLGFSWRGVKSPVLWSVGVCGVCVLLSESGQLFLPSRTADVRDLLWGMSGACVGVVSAWVSIHLTHL